MTPEGVAAINSPKWSTTFGYNAYPSTISPYLSAMTLKTKL